jgi:erythromycin esterase-like protein
MALLEKVRSDDREILALLTHHGEPLPGWDGDEFGHVFERFGDAKVVLLGEATHGTSEFYRARAAISRALIERCGFNILAVEADWPDAARVDRFVRHRSPELSEEQAFARFPTWMWRNVEAHDFVLWLRAYNERHAPDACVEFRGLDIYSLGSSMAAVLAYLDKKTRKARKRRGDAMAVLHLGRMSPRATAARYCTAARPANRK